MRPTCNSGDEQVIGNIKSKVVDVAHLRIEIEDILTGAREYHAKKLTPLVRGVIKQKRGEIRVLKGVIISELKKLPVCEQIRISEDFPLLKKLAEKAIQSLPPAK